MKKVMRRLFFAASLFVLIFCLSGGAVQAASKKIAINKKSVIVIKKKTTKISMKNTGRSKVQWKSSNKKIATVKAKGATVTITGVKAGTCNVLAKVKGKIYTCKVTVRNAPALSASKLSVTVGKTASISINNTYGAKVAWSTSNKKVAAIKANGAKVKVKGKKAGTCNIVAKVGNVKYTCKLTVKQAPAQKQPVKQETAVQEPTAQEPAVQEPTAQEPAAVKPYWNVDNVYLTGDDTLDYMAEYICRKVVKPSMTQEEQMKKLYDYVVRLSVHYGSSKQVGKINFKLSSASTIKKIKNYAAENEALVKAGKAKNISTIKGYEDLYYWYGLSNFFQTGNGDCGHVAGAYQVLLGHIGIQSFVIESTGPGGLHHLWNAVLYKGKYYAADADAENDNYVKVVDKGGQPNYLFYMKGQKTMKQYGYVFPTSRYPAVQKKDSGL